MRDIPITKYVDLFPTEIRKLRGESFVLHDGSLPLITKPKSTTIEAGQFKGKWAKNKKNYRKSITTRRFLVSSGCARVPTDCS